MTRAAAKTTAPGTLPAADPLESGYSILLLQELHILTREGRINQDSRRKLKQVQHLVQFIEPLLREPPLDAARGPVVVDHGAGKSYLGFILYDRALRKQADGAVEGRGEVWGIETRAELVERSRMLAQRLGFERMHFLHLDAADAVRSTQIPQAVDVVTALHACDTATDDAIDFGIARGARHIVVVPCCQAELAGRLRQHKALSLARSPLAELWRHPLHTREMGSQLTNVLRCLYLEACGWQVTVTELVGWEHSMKNELILARNTGKPRRSAAQRLRALLAEFGLEELQPLRYARLPQEH